MHYSAISGTVWQEIRSIVYQPELLIDLLAKSLADQSAYFIQLCFISVFSTWLIDGLHLSRVGMGILRTYVGPNLTARERKKPFVSLKPLAMPEDFRFGIHMSGLVGSRV